MRFLGTHRRVAGLRPREESERHYSSRLERVEIPEGIIDTVRRRIEIIKTQTRALVSGHTRVDAEVSAATSVLRAKLVLSPDNRVLVTEVTSILVCFKSPLNWGQLDSRERDI